MIKTRQFDNYREIIHRLSRGEAVYLDRQTKDPAERYSFKDREDAIPLHSPRIAVYAGAGASHSWLWFVDVLEEMGFTSISFLTEDNIESGLEDRDAFLVSGGETFALAHGLGEKGKGAIIKLLKRGGLYFGSCAGACMMMRSTSEPLGLFDLVNIKIANIVDELPEQVKPSKKFSSPYGCAFVFHPVREEVLLKPEGIPPLYNDSGFVAPLYGGPPMEESNDVIPLARYAGFTSKTEFLAAPEKAGEILIGKTAVCMKRHERGHIILAGPHLEHPSFHEANKIIADSIFFSLADGYDRHYSKAIAFPLKRNTIVDLKREISNLRIIALGLEQSTVSWLVGRKYYEPEKIRTYAESIWKRIIALEKTGDTIVFSADVKLLENAASLSKDAVKITRDLKNMVDRNEHSDDAAAELFQMLRTIARDFFTYFFSRG